MLKPGPAVAVLLAWLLAPAIPALAGEDQPIAPAQIIFSEMSRTISMFASLPRSAGLDAQLLTRVRGETEQDFQDMRGMADTDYADQQEYGDGPFNPYSFSINWSEHFISDRYLSLLKESSSYTGGAHGSESYTSLVWDLSEGREIGLPDFLNNANSGSAALNAIARQLRESLVAEKMLRFDFTEEEARQDVPMMEPLAATPGAMSTFVFIPSRDPGKVAGLTFIYARYVLGPFAEGDYWLYVPASVFTEFLKPEFKALFGGEPVRMERLSSSPTPGATILLEDPHVSSGITSPLALNGEATDFWFGDDVVRVEVYVDGNLIGKGEVKSLPEAMPSGAASGMVRFLGEVAFENQPPGTDGEIWFLRGAWEISGAPEKIIWRFSFGS